MSRYKPKLNQVIYVFLYYIPLGGPASFCETIHANRVKHVDSQEETLRSHK